MTRDHWLFLIIGALVGFIAGYLLHEEMAEVQPQRLVHGGGAQAGAAPAPSRANQVNPGRPNPGAPGGVMPGGQGGGPAVPEVAALTRRVAENPEDSEAVLRLAQLNFQIRNWIRARDLFQQYLNLKPDGEPGGPSRAEVLLDLGNSHRSIGDLEKAVEAFDGALAAAPGNWLALYNTTLVLGLDQGRYEEAAEVMAELRRVRPDDPRVDRLGEELARRSGAG